MYRTLLAVTALTALPVANAHESSIRYNYAEFRYAESEVDIDGTPEDIDGDGFQVNGFVELGDSFHLFLGYDRLEFDDDVDLSTTLVGGGLDFSLSRRTDLFVRFAFADARFETPFFEDEDDGTYLAAGIRTMLHRDIELYGSLASLDLEDGGDEEIATAGLDFFLNENLALGPAVQVIDDTTTWSLGAKVYF